MASGDMSTDPVAHSNASSGLTERDYRWCHKCRVKFLNQEFSKHLVEAHPGLHKFCTKPGCVERIFRVVEWGVVPRYCYLHGDYFSHHDDVGEFRSMPSHKPSGGRFQEVDPPGRSHRHVRLFGDGTFDPGTQTVTKDEYLLKLQEESL